MSEPQPTVDVNERYEFIFTRNHQSGNMVQIATSITGAVETSARILTDEEADQLNEAISDILGIIDKKRERMRQDAKQNWDLLDGSEQQPDQV